MEYTNEPDQRRDLIKAINALASRKIPNARIVREINAWANGSTKPGTEARTFISQTMYSYIARGEKEISPEKGAILFEFFRQSSDFKTALYDPDRSKNVPETDVLASLMRGYYQSSDFSYPYEAIKSLEGRYVMYRPCWLSDDKYIETHFMQSEVTIIRENGTFVLNENQDYNFAGIPVLQNDVGPIFSYSTNFFALTNSFKGLKFYAIDTVYPSLDLEGKELADFFSGNLIAISGKGPHPGYKFFCKRHHGNSKVDHGVFDRSLLENNSKTVDISEKIFHNKE